MGNRPLRKVSTNAGQHNEVRRDADKEVYAPSEVRNHDPSVWALRKGLRHSQDILIGHWFFFVLLNYKSDYILLLKLRLEVAGSIAKLVPVYHTIRRHFPEELCPSGKTKEHIEMWIPASLNSITTGLTLKNSELLTLFYRHVRC
jgi:hypothetical protein